MRFRRAATTIAAAVACLVGWSSAAAAAPAAVIERPSQPSEQIGTTEILISIDTYDLAGNLVSSQTLPPAFLLPNSPSGPSLASGGSGSLVTSPSGCRNQTFTVTRRFANVVVFELKKSKHYCWSNNRVYGPNGTSSDPALGFWPSKTLGATDLLSWHWAQNYYFNYNGLGTNSGHRSMASASVKTCVYGVPVGCLTEFPNITVSVHGNGTWWWQWFDGD